MDLRRLAWLPLAFGLGIQCGCAGEPPALFSITDFEVTVLPTIGEGTHIQLRWTGHGASSYRIEVGKTQASPDVAVIEVDETSYTWRSAPIGKYYIRVRPQRPEGGSGGTPSELTVVASIDPRDMAEALLLGSGRYAWPGALRYRVLGWEPGSSIEFVVDDSLAPTTISSIERTVAQIEPATHHRLHARVRLASPPLPEAGDGQVTVEMVSWKDMAATCGESHSSCAWAGIQGSFVRHGRIVLPERPFDAEPAREIGLVLGLDYIDGPEGIHPIFTMDNTLYAVGQLDVLDPATVKLLDMLYAAGLTAGTTQRQLQDAGFVAGDGSAALAAPAEDFGRSDAGGKDEEVVVFFPPAGRAPDEAAQ